MIGQTISHYKILEKLGEGGMGVVYKAHDTKLDRDVALKFLPHYLTSDPNEKERFYHEAKAAAALTHQNIAVIHEIGEHDGQVFIVMECVEGKTLRQVLSCETLPIKKVLDTAIQIAEGLAAAHERGIVHRDIKPENIIITPKAQAKITDFGLAKLKGATKLTKAGSTLGTAAYMSPEQARGEDVDARTDIFSFGVCLYEMLAGRPPFRGEHTAALMYSIANEEPAPLARFNQAVTDELQYVVSKALEKDRDDRYQHADDLLADLRRQRKKLEYTKAGYVSQSVSTEVPITRVEEQAAVPARRKRGTLLTVGGIVLISAILLFILLITRRSTSINPNWIQHSIQIPFTDIGYPGISGDGNWIGFSARDHEGKWGLYIMNTVRGEPRFVTALKNRQYVDVSADGSLLSYDQGNSQTGKNEGYVIYSNGGTPRRIVQGCYSLRFRPDGQRVGYMLTTYPNSRSPSGKCEFWSAGIDGTDPRREFIDSLSFTEGSLSFSYSPNCRKVAWLRRYPGRYEEIIVHNLETGTESVITSDKKHIDELVWVRDDRIVYTTDKSGNFNVWMISANGGDPVQITNGTEPILGVKASADGQKILCQQTKAVADLWIIDIMKNRSHQVTFTEDNQYNPAFSPDGKEIAVIIGGAAEVGGGAFYNSSHLYIMDRNGGDRRQLSFGDELVYGVTWSPDGKRIAYSSRRLSEPFDSIRTYVIEPSNPGSPKYVTLGIPGLWVDSMRIMVVVNYTVYVTSVDRPSPSKVYDDSTFSECVMGGKYILSFDLRAGQTEPSPLWLIDGTKPREEQRRTARKLPWTTTYGITSVGPGRFLYQLRGAGEIWRMALPEGKEERIVGDFLKADDINNCSPSWDGKEMIVVKKRQSTKIVMIENLFK